MLDYVTVETTKYDWYEMVFVASLIKTILKIVYPIQCK